mmetsp:Transcript_5863/g.13021  ORF Transcript_5863/g.13021 Transcript_5863/m.13021 type:complete len:212 (-) Transcript_5863:185-820(-)
MPQGGQRLNHTSWARGDHCGQYIEEEDVPRHTGHHQEGPLRRTLARLRDEGRDPPVHNVGDLANIQLRRQWRRQEQQIACGPALNHQALRHRHKIGGHKPTVNLTQRAGSHHHSIGRPNDQRSAALWEAMQRRNSLPVRQRDTVNPVHRNGHVGRQGLNRHQGQLVLCGYQELLGTRDRSHGSHSRQIQPHYRPLFRQGNLPDPLCPAIST